MIRIRTGLAALAIVLTGGLFGSAPAGAAFIAETTDPAGDSSGNLPGQDLVAVGLGFDQKTGYMVGAIALRGAPEVDHGAFLTLYAGTKTPSGCDGHPVGGFGSRTDDDFDATWVREDAPGVFRHGEAEKTTSNHSTLQTFEVRTRKLAGKKWNCFGANLTDPEDPSMVYDRVKPVRFKGLPAMSMRMPKVRRAITPNRKHKLKVVISNPGDAPLRSVRVRFRRDRGLKVSPRSRKIKVIRPGQRRAVPVNVRVTRAAGETATLDVTARSGKLVAKGSTKLRLKLPKKKPPKGGGGNGGSGVCVQFFPDLSGETGGSLGLVPC